MKKVLFIGATFYDFRDPESVSHLKEKFMGLAGDVQPHILARGRPFHKKIWNSDFYLLPNRFFYWMLAFPLSFLLCLTKKIDTIVAQSPLLEGFVGLVLKLFLRKELIIEIHGDWRDAPFLSKERRLSNLQKKFVPILAAFSLKKADKIRAISNWTKEAAVKIAPNKPFFTFPTFTDIDSFLEEKKITFENFILFAGALERVKAVDILIKTFAEVVNDFPSFKLIIIGGGKETPNLKSQAVNLKITNRVEFKGRLSLKETKEIMKRCYCLVLPSLSEGLGRVLLEAMALSKPVIGSRAGGIPDLIKDNYNGFLFEVGNVKELAGKLKILLKNRDLATAMGERGRAMAREKFSNQKYVRNYLQMLNA